MKQTVITLLVHTATNIMQPNQIVVFKLHFKTLTHKQPGMDSSQLKVAYAAVKILGKIELIIVSFFFS